MEAYAENRAASTGLLHKFLFIRCLKVFMNGYVVTDAARQPARNQGGSKEPADRHKILRKSSPI